MFIDHTVSYKAIIIIIIITYSIVAISSKRIKLSSAPSTRVGQSHSHGTMQNSSTNDWMQWKPRRDK